MEKTFLEKRIRERAEKQTEKEYQDFINMLRKNKFANALKIKINDEEIPLFNFGCNYALLNNNGIENKRSIHTNLEEVYDKILNENIKENTDVILGKMESIAYLFGE